MQDTVYEIKTMSMLNLVQKVLWIYYLDITEYCNNRVKISKRWKIQLDNVRKRAMRHLGTTFKSSSKVNGKIVITEVMISLVSKERN